MIYLISSFILLLSKTSWACSVCFFGAPNDQANVALRAGVLVLLLLVFAVLGGFIKFFWSVYKKSKLST